MTGSCKTPFLAQFRYFFTSRITGSTFAPVRFRMEPSVMFECLCPSRAGACLLVSTSLAAFARRSRIRQSAPASFRATQKQRRIGCSSMRCPRSSRTRQTLPTVRRRVNRSIRSARQVPKNRAVAAQPMCAVACARKDRGFAPDPPGGSALWAPAKGLALGTLHLNRWIAKVVSRVVV